MRHFKVVAAVLVLSLLPPALSGHGQDPKKKDDRLGTLMHKKLEQAQKVLEGIALNDFEKIAKGADELIDISKRAEWRIIKTPQYEVHSNDFRRVADTMHKSAKEKNLDAAALNYVELTLTCVKCHKYVREVRMTGFEE